MSVMALRMMAKELAGSFYEMKRSGRFRDPEALTRAKTLATDPKTGAIVEVPVMVKFCEAYPNAHKFALAHWPFFYDAARRCFTTMLALPNVAEHKKKIIYEALIEDREREMKNGGKRLLQVNPQPYHKDAVSHAR